MTATSSTEYVVDSNGRKGIVTRSEYHAGGFFARPAEYDYVEGDCIMATWFSDDGDGTFSGRWADSKIGSERITIKLA
jgi:hypothetical protein